MGIRFLCPNGHKLHVKSYLAGRRGVCPKCGVSVDIPNEAEPAVPVASGSVAQIPASQSFTIDPTAGSVDTTSQSIIIAVADPVLSSKSSEAIPRVVVPEPVQTTSSAPLFEVPSDSAATVSASPADRYVARRARNRRNQVYIAITLLVSVIVLAAILVFVLQRGSSTPPETTNPPADNKAAASDFQSAASTSHLATL